MNKREKEDPEYYGSGEMRKWLKTLGLPSGATWFANELKDGGELPKPIKIGNRNYWSRKMREEFIEKLQARSAEPGKAK